MKMQVEPPRISKTFRTLVAFAFVVSLISLSVKLTADAFKTESSLVDKAVSAVQGDNLTTRWTNDLGNWKGVGWSGHGLLTDDFQIDNVVEWRYPTVWLNDFNPTGLYKANLVWMVTPQGGTTLTGLWAGDDYEGRLIHIANAGPGPLKLINEFVDSQAKSRFHLDSDVVYVGAHSLFTVLYDGVLRRWRVIWGPDGCRFYDQCVNWFGTVSCSPSRACFPD